MQYSARLYSEAWSGVVTEVYFWDNMFGLS